MNTKHKLVTAGIAAAVIAVLGVLTFSPSDIPYLGATIVTPTIALRNVKNQPGANSQCPYLSCPYLNRLHQMAQEKGANPGAMNPGQACPYELNHAQNAVHPMPNKKPTMLVDDHFTRQETAPKIRTASWEIAH